MSKWTLVTTLVSKDGTRGHRIFRNSVGRLAIADNSGATPDSTDDGVLWISSVSMDDSYITFHLHNGTRTCDDLTEVNATRVAEVAREHGFRFEGTTWIGKLVAREVMA